MAMSVIKCLAATELGIYATWGRGGGGGRGGEGRGDIEWGWSHSSGLQPGMAVMRVKEAPPTDGFCCACLECMLMVPGMNGRDMASESRWTTQAGVWHAWVGLSAFVSDSWCKALVSHDKLRNL
jgi:hypothetical protein